MTKRTTKPRRVAIYTRVSTDGQTTENQRRELEAVAESAGWEIVGTYEDAGISGAKGRDQRPAFDRLYRDAAARKFDIVAVWSVDRLGRSLQDLVAFLNELKALRIDLFLKQQGIDTTTPGGVALYQMLGVFSQFERAMIQDRVKSGLERARAAQKAAEEEGARTGKPVRREGRNGRPLKHGKLGRPSVVTDKHRAQIAALKAEGGSVRGIAKAIGLSPARVQAVLTGKQK